MASRPRDRSMGMQPTFQAYQPMTGTRMTSFFMMKARCGKALAIEYNGDLYSCDHFVYPEYKLGNIREVHEGDLVFSELQKKFAYAKSETLPQYCKSCAYLELCWGECPKNRFIKTPDGEKGLNYLCPGLKKFYAKVTAERGELARRMGR